MYCDKCKLEHPVGKKFCRSCGSPLVEIPKIPSPQCPACGAQVIPGKKFCRNCGVSLGDIRITREPAVPTCPKCGHQTTPGKQFCKYCGHNLTEGKEPGQSEPAGAPYASEPLRPTTEIAHPLNGQTAPNAATSSSPAPGESYSGSP